MHIIQGRVLSCFFVIGVANVAAGVLQACDGQDKYDE